MRYKPGAKAPVAGIYWCSVCKRPAALIKDEDFPPCPNRCARGLWVLVRETEEESKNTAD